MNFFRIYHSLNSKELGKYPQVGDAIIPTTWEDPNYISQYTHKKAPDNVYLPKGILAARAKKTDLITVCFAGFELNLYISNELKEIIEESLNFGVQFLETSLIIPPDKEYQYWIVHAFKYGYSYLDLDKTLFSYNESLNTKVPENYFKFYSVKEIENKYIQLFEESVKEPMDYKPLYINKIALKNNIHVDFFALGSVLYGGLGYFVSDKLKNIIETAGCTGLRFTEINEYPF